MVLAVKAVVVATPLVLVRAVVVLVVVLTRRDAALGSHGGVKEEGWLVWVDFLGGKRSD